MTQTINENLQDAIRTEEEGYVNQFLLVQKIIWEWAEAELDEGATCDDLIYEFNLSPGEAHMLRQIVAHDGMLTV